MSKQGAEAEALKMAEAAAVQESEVRNLRPVEGSPEAEAVSGEREAVSDVMKLPLFEEAVAAIESVESGDNKALDQLSHAYGNKKVKFVKRMPLGPKGGAGWHCSAQEKGPLTVEQSQQLADMINEKIDVDKMNADAEKSGAARKRKKAKKESAESKKKSLESFELDKLKEVIDGIEDIKKLTDFVYDSKRAGLIRVKGGRKWEVLAVEDLEGSAKLVQAINSKKKKILKEIGVQRNKEKREKEKFERQLKGIERAINEKEDVLELEKLSFQFLQNKLGLVKKRNGRKRGEWTVEAVEGKAGSKEVVKMILERKAVLEVRGKTADLINKYNQ